jgi:hypothetical protein
MFRSLLGIVAILASTATLALADPKDDIQAAIQKITDAGNYSWTTTIDAQGGFGSGTQEGKVQKDGLTSLTMSFGDNSMQFLIKGDQVAIKNDDGWHTPAELANADNGGGGFNPGRMAGMMARTFKAPAATAQDLLDKLQNLQVADGVYSADLTEDAAKQMLTFRRRANANADAPAPEISNAKATIKLWLTGGALTKSEIHVTGTVSFNGNDRDIDRTTTVEFKDVGNTTVDVPADAQAKLTAPASQPAAQ